MKINAEPCNRHASPIRAAASPGVEPRWYAVFTVPRNEKTVVKHLEIQEVESFLPTYSSVRVWKNRQRVKLLLPLFPTYLFVRIQSSERSKVLKSPGVLQILGGGDRDCLSDSEIDLMRSGPWSQRMEPYRDLVIGQKVRIKSGVMQGIEGTLVRKGGSARFVLTIELINQHVAMHVDAEDLEPALM